VILNAANSTVGQLIIQLCALLQLRCVAVVRDHGNPKVIEWLKDLGATVVINDEVSIKVR
jgi:mitochondrial enoyl-[acyl-carrier protein] reductase / trans-2-enoyl-CoA reductase